MQHKHDGVCWSMRQILACPGQHHYLPALPPPDYVIGDEEESEDVLAYLKARNGKVN